MHPRYSRMLVEAAKFGCVPAAALCAALVSGRDMLMRLGRDDKHIQEARELFEASQESDFYTLVRAYQFAKKNNFSVEPCRRYGIHAQTARQVEQTFEQILQIARQRDLSGVRPSPGAATFATSGTLECSDVPSEALPAAPGDGRTPSPASRSTPPSRPLAPLSDDRLHRPALPPSRPGHAGLRFDRRSAGGADARKRGADRAALCGGDDSGSDGAWLGEPHIARAGHRGETGVDRGNLPGTGDREGGTSLRSHAQARCSSEAGPLSGPGHPSRAPTRGRSAGFWPMPCGGVSEGLLRAAVIQPRAEAAHQPGEPGGGRDAGTGVSTLQ